jgi:6-phosphogluconolactonase
MTYMDMQVFDSVDNLARAAAQKVIDDLQQAIETYGNAAWVIAGGTTPMAAYGVLAQTAIEALDWTKVTVIIGDERCVPFDSPDSNWSQAEAALLGRLHLSALSLRPASNLPAEESAAHYQAQLERLPKNDAGLPRLDHVWLGMGEDGHTLSLFPNHVSSQDSSSLVIAVHDSPKPPPDRISLTLRALQGARSCLIMAAGPSKAPVIADIAAGNNSYPVAHAAQTVHAAGGTVVWYVDKPASTVHAVK